MPQHPVYPPISPVQPLVATDLLSEEQKRGLSQYALKVLSRVKVEYNPNLPSSGLYVPAVDQVGNILPGKIVIGKNKYNRPEGDIILHESIHALDSAKNWAPSNSFPAQSLPLSERNKLYSRYWQTPSLSVVPGTEKGAVNSSFGMSNMEAYATEGMRGYSDIPSNLRQYFPMLPSNTVSNKNYTSENRAQITPEVAPSYNDWADRHKPSTPKTASAQPLKRRI